MSTKDQTHEAIAKALTNGDPLTDEQRALLLGLVADDKVWQRECDRLREAGQALVDAYRECYRKPSTTGIRQGSPLLQEFAAFNGALNGAA